MSQGQVESQDVHCQICGTILTNPKSIERGIGPECCAQDTVNRLLDKVARDLQVAGFNQAMRSQDLREVKDKCQKIYVNRKEGQIVISHDIPVVDAYVILSDLRRYVRAYEIKIDEKGILRYQNGARVIPAPPQLSPAEIIKQAETRLAEITQELQEIKVEMWNLDDPDTELEAEQRVLLAEWNEIEKLLNRYAITQHGIRAAKRQWSVSEGKQAERELTVLVHKNLQELATLVA